MVIKSKDNLMFKNVLMLTLKKGRDRENAFIIEGERFVKEALEYCNVRYIIACETYMEKKSDFARALTGKTIVFSEALFKAVSTTDNTGGVLAVCDKMPPPEDVLDFSKPGKMFLLCEAIQDPGNLGALIRVADAAGAGAVILSRGCVEVYNPKVLRGSAGSVFHVPILEDADLPEVISELKNNGVRIYAAHLKGAAYPYGLNLTGTCAFVIGSEGEGLSRETASLADTYIKLPIIGKAESLNAAVASGILLYEAVRQRLEANG